MYRVVIVEDDRIIRQSLAQGDWESIGAKVVGQESNGQDALSTIEETRPHLLITDINMPFMDGIELAKQVREKHEHTRIIFLTGYDDFEYLHEALLLKSDDYILKPVQINELLSKGKKAMDAWEIENNKSVQLKNSLPILQRDFLSDLLYGTFDFSEEELAVELKKLNLSVTDSHFVVYNFLIPSYHLSDSLFSYIAPIVDNRHVKVVATDQNELLIIAGVSHDSLDQLRQVKDKVRELTEAKSISFGMSQSSVYAKHTDMKKALLEVRIEMETYLAKESNPSDEESLSSQLTELKRIETFIDLLKTQAFSLTESKKKGVSMATYIVTQLNHARRDEKDKVDVYKINQAIVSAEKQETLYAILKDLLDQWQVFLEKESVSNSLVKRAKTYLDKHFSESEINLNYLADRIHVTAPYLSNLFKLETGMNFTDYLLDRRMEKAKQLLKDSSLRTYEIANQVGYKNAYYFSSSFKKYTNQTPTEFRKAHS